MGNEPVTENPYQPPQSDLRQERATPALQPLTSEIGLRFLITTVASSVILFAAHHVPARYFKSENLPAQYSGGFSWEGILTYATQKGFAYGTLFAVSILCCTWFFCKNRTNPKTLWVCYFSMLGILLSGWLCGGIFGLLAHYRGWYGWLPKVGDYELIHLTMHPLTAWFFGAFIYSMMWGIIGLVAIPLLFTIRNRKRVSSPLGN